MYPCGGEGSWKKSCLAVSLSATRLEIGMCVAICWMISVGSAVKVVGYERPAPSYCQGIIFGSMV
jgi:hypothetical protein